MLGTDGTQLAPLLALGSRLEIENMVKCTKQEITHSKCSICFTFDLDLV